MRCEFACTRCPGLSVGADWREPHAADTQHGQQQQDTCTSASDHTRVQGVPAHLYDGATHALRGGCSGESSGCPSSHSRQHPSEPYSHAGCYERSVRRLPQHARGVAFPDKPDVLHQYRRRERWCSCSSRHTREPRRTKRSWNSREQWGFFHEWSTNQQGNVQRELLGHSRHVEHAL